MNRWGIGYERRRGEKKKLERIVEAVEDRELKQEVVRKRCKEL